MGRDPAWELGSGAGSSNAGFAERHDLQGTGALKVKAKRIKKAPSSVSHSRGLTGVV